MNFKTLAVAAALTFGVVAMESGPVMAQAQDGILFKARAGNSNYCHLKFPAIRADSLATDRPVLQDPSTGTIVDFYGPCDYNPTGKAAVQAQRRVNSHRFNREYLD